MRSAASKLTRNTGAISSAPLENYRKLLAVWRLTSAPFALFQQHWPEYLMEAGESGLYLFSACAVATLLWHPASPVQRHLPNDAVRRMLMGVAMGASIIAIVLTPWGKQSGAHLNPAVTFAFYRLRKVAPWDAAFYCAAQMLGAVSGVGLGRICTLIPVSRSEGLRLPAQQMAAQGEEQLVDGEAERGGDEDHDEDHVHALLGLGEVFAGHV